MKTPSPFFEDGVVVSVFLHCVVAFVILISPLFIVPKVRNSAVQTPLILDLASVEIGRNTIVPKVVEQPVIASKHEAIQPAPSPVIPAKAGTQESIEEELISFTPKNAPAAERKERVEKLLQNISAPTPPITKEIKKGIEATEIGSEGGVANLAKPLSVSYIDAIRIKLRSCWNIDAGAKDLKDMVIHIRAELSQTGDVISATVTDNEDSSWFNAVANSARRAVIVCSPYSLLPAENYDEWKVINFAFYPGQGIVQ